MTGFIIVVLGFNLFWIISDSLNGRNYFDRYNIKEYGWLAFCFWLYTLSGVVALIYKLTL